MEEEKHEYAQTPDGSRYTHVLFIHQPLGRCIDVSACV